jgi:hypothetical protein
MKLSSEQLERLSERVFKVLKNSGYIGLDIQADERIEEKVCDAMLSVLEDDMRMEDKLAKEAERLVQQQSQIARSSGKTFEELVEEVKTRLAKSKRMVLGDGPDRADTLAEKVLRVIWKLEAVDFFAEDSKVQNCIARAIYRFRMEDDRVVDAVEKVVNKRTKEEPYSAMWCLAYDKCFGELKQKIAAQIDKSTPEASRL